MHEHDRFTVAAPIQVPDLEFADGSPVFRWALADRGVSQRRLLSSVLYWRVRLIHILFTEAESGNPSGSALPDRHQEHRKIPSRPNASNRMSPGLLPSNQRWWLPSVRSSMPSRVIPSRRTGCPGGRAASAGQAMEVEKAAYRLTAQVNTLPFRRPFGQVVVNESGVFLVSQHERGATTYSGTELRGLRPW